MTISPKTHRRNLYFQTLIDGSYNSARVAAFLRDLLKQVPGRIIVVWDNGPMHKGPAIRQLLKRNPRLTLEWLPPYAPELNPVEQLWSHLKFGYCSNFIPDHLLHLDHADLAAGCGGHVEIARGLAEHDVAGREAQVAADLEAGLVDRRRQPLVVAQVVDQVFDTRDQARGFRASEPAQSDGRLVRFLGQAFPLSGFAQALRVLHPRRG
mgnify:CR=1 FL=1